LAVIGTSGAGTRRRRALLELRAAGLTDVTIHLRSPVSMYLDIKIIA
jgi:hypothetical protein